MGSYCIPGIAFQLWKMNKSQDLLYSIMRASQVALGVKSPPADAGGTYEAQVGYLGQEDSLEEGMATHSSIIAWEVPWTEEPG